MDKPPIKEVESDVRVLLQDLGKLYTIDWDLMQEYEDLKVLIAEIEADISKAEGGNKAAGTRVRKQMQKVKQAAQVVRSRILEIRSTE